MKSPDTQRRAKFQLHRDGWAMGDVPAPPGSIEMNRMLLSSILIPRPRRSTKGVEKGSEDKKTNAGYHNGSLVGLFSSIHVLLT